MRGKSNITHLKVAYANLPPFVSVTTVDGVDQLDGFMPQIVRAVANWMRIELEFFREPFDTYGVKENDTYTGMIGMLHRKEVDMIMNPILPKEEFLEFAYYTNPITIEAYTILSGKERADAGIFLYFSVLSKEVWAGIVTAMIIISVTATVLHRNILQSHHFKWVNMVFQYVWILFSYMLRQVPSEKFLLRKSRSCFSYFLPFLITLWVLCISFLVMNTFQSLLVSKLALKRTLPIIDTLADLVDKKSTICIAPREIQIEHVIQNSSNPVFRKAWKYVSHDMPTEIAFSNETLGEVQDGKYCIIHGHLIIKNNLKKFFRKFGTCSMYLSEKYFYPFSLPIALHKKLPTSFNDVFNFGVTRLMEADITGKWFKSDLEISNLCTSYTDNTLKPLGLESIHGVLLIWLAGISISMAVLLFEIYIRNLEIKYYSS